jgi:hypothetical protein
VECSTLTIQFGPAFFWCLTFLLSGFTGYLSWNARRIFDNWLTERALRRGQLALLGSGYIPLEKRPKTARAVIPYIDHMRVKEESLRDKGDAARARPGWRKLGGYPYNVAAE